MVMEEVDEDEEGTMDEEVDEERRMDVDDEEEVATVPVVRALSLPEVEARQETVLTAIEVVPDSEVSMDPKVVAMEL